MRKQQHSHSLARAAVTLLAALLGFQTGAWATITGSGSATAPFVIHDAGDWAAFAANVNNGTTTYENLYVKLSDDFDNSANAVTAKVGTVNGSAQGNPFKGIFDGNGKTLYVDITDNDNQGTALFCYINGATIKNLTVEGSVSSEKEHAAGLVGFSKDANNHIEDCIVRATVNGGTHVGGILGHGLNSDVAIERCAFSGTITGGGTAKGVIFGWGDDGGNKSITDCLYVMQSEQNTLNLDLVKLYGGSVAVTRCYKTTDVGTYGTQVFTTAPADGISKQLTLADANSYYVPCIVSGVEPYYLYTGSEIPVAYTVTDFNGNLLTLGTHYTAAFSPTTVQEAGNYTLTLTGIEPYTGSKDINFTVGEGEPVTSGTTTFEDGMIYKVTENVTVSSDRITVGGSVKLILGEGTTLTASKGIEVSTGKQLTIEGTGKLVSTGTQTGNATGTAGIGGYEYGDITINGGTVEATGGYRGAGIGGSSNSNFGGTITINGGIVTAQGGTEAAGIGGGSGLGWSGAYGKCGAIVINGGQVTAKGGTSAPGIGPGYDYDDENNTSGSLTLGWTNATDFISVTGESTGDYCGFSNRLGSISLAKDFIIQGGGLATTNNIKNVASVYLVPLSDEAKKDLAYASITGIEATYYYTGSAITLSYTVTDANGTELTKGTHYTEEFQRDGNAVNEVKEQGTYTLTITAVSGSGYTGSKSVTFTVSLPAPSDLAASSITKASAVINWKENGDAIKWVVAYKENGAADFTEVEANEKPFTLTGLKTLTQYTVKVRPYNYETNWSAEISFTTAAGIPLVEGFGTTSPTGWSMYVGELDKAGTATLSSTSDAWDFGSRYGNGVFDDHASAWIHVRTNRWLVMPSLNLTDNLELTFSIALTSATGDEPTAPNETDGRFIVLVSTDEMSHWTILREWNNSGSEYVYNDIPHTAVGENVSISLSGYANQNVYIAFYAESRTTSKPNRLHIDNVSIDHPISESCQTPTDVTISNITGHSATISWTSDATTCDLLVGENVIEGVTSPYTLSNLDSETTYSVKVRANCGENSYSHWTNPVSFTTTVSCPVPTTLACTATTPNSATLSWTENGTARAWIVAYKKTNDADFTEVSVDANNVGGNSQSPTFTLTGLTASTTYTFKVKAVNSEEDMSEWSALFSFSTTCGAITSFPWTETFESYGAGDFINPCWVNERIQDGEGSGSLSVFKVYTGSNGGNATHQLQLPDMRKGTLTKLVLPEMTLPGENYEFVLDVYRSSTSCGNALEGIRVYASTDGEIEGATELAFIPRYNMASSTAIPAEQSTGWHTYELPIRMSGTCYIILRGESQYCTSTYMDNFTVEKVPTCITPTGLAASNLTAHGATLSWIVKDATQTTWEVQMATDGDFTENVQLLQDINNHEGYELSGLAPETTYYVRVRANCGDGDVSKWSNTASFTTTIPCPAPTNLAVTPRNKSAEISWDGTSDSYKVSYRTAAYADDFTEVFNNSGVPSGWTSYSGLVDAVIDGTATLSTTANGWGTTNYAMGQYNMKLNIYGTDRKDWLVTPEFNLSGGSLCFDLALTDYGNANRIEDNTQQADDRFVVLIYADDAWHVLREWNNSGSEYVYNNISYTGENVTIDLSAYNGKNVKIAFYGESTESNNGDNDLHIDNVFCGTLHPAGEWQTVTVEEAPATIPNLTPETAYDVKVQGDCGNLDGLSPETNIVTFTTLEACLAPTDLAVSNITTNSVTLNWTENNDDEGTSWVVAYKTADVENFTEVEVYSNPFTLTGLTAETTYEAKVRSVVGEKQSAWSAAISFEPTAKLVIGSGTATNSNIPTTTYYNQSLTQQIYTAAELGEAGLIESIDFYCAAANSSTTRVLDIYMVNTDKNSFSGNSDWITVTAADKVYSGSCLFAAGWNSFTLDKPFVYDGTQNVAIIVDDNAGDYDTSNNFRVYDATAQALYIYSDGTNYDPTAPSSYSGYVLNVKNQIRILKSPLGDCMKPTNFKATEVGPNQATLSWVEHGTATAWVIDFNGNTVEANENPFTLTGLTPETEYTVKVRPVCDESLWSTAITFTTTNTTPAPIDLAVTNVGPTTATVNWKGFADIYNLRYHNYNPLDFEDGMGAWTTIDADGDGFCWDLHVNTGSDNYNSHSGDGIMTSGSYDHNQGALTPDNYLVSPKITLGGTISFWACAQDPKYPYEHFGVAVSTKGNTDAADFSTLKEWTIENVSEYVLYTVDLSAYAGQEGYVAIRHFDCTDMFYLNIDDIEIDEPGVAWITIENISSNSQEITGLEPGTQYIVQVQGNYDAEGLSDWSSIVFTTLSAVTLANDDTEKPEEEKNSAIIDANNGKAAQVTLADRTLYKDGYWNTLCLPFNLTLEGSPLADAEARTLDAASIDGTTLILNFSNPVSELTAGTPYIIKWDSGSDIDSPVFNGVTIDKTMDDKAFAGVLTFKGNYDYQSFTEVNNSILFMSGGNTLNWPEKGARIGACRAYFQLADGITAGSVSNARLFFGSDDTQGIISIENGKSNIDRETEGWYSLDGKKLNGAPKQKGVYIQNGYKVVIK